MEIQGREPSRELRWCTWKLAPHTDGRKGPKREAGHSRLVGDNFNSKGNLHSPVLGSTKTQGSLIRPPNLLSL